jgi:hypothetical protein
MKLLVGTEYKTMFADVIRLQTFTGCSQFSMQMM